MGHEITHAFDDFVTNLKSSEYQQKVDCVIKSFSANEVEVRDERRTLTKIQLNGAKTITEDIADLGGIKLSFNAFKKYSKLYPEKYTSLGGLDFTKEQLFFLSYAQFYCNIERPQKIRQQIDEDVHSLNRFRVLEPLKNLREFHEAFKCQPNDEMFRPVENRCEVW